MAGSTGMKVDSGTGQKLSGRPGLGHSGWVGNTAMVAIIWLGLVPGLSEVTRPTGAEVMTAPWPPFWLRLAMPLSRLRLRCAASKPTGMESPLVWWSGCSGKAGPGLWGCEDALESASVVRGLVESGQVQGHE